MSRQHPITRALLLQAASLLLLALGVSEAALAQTLSPGRNASVTLVNGYANVEATDLGVQSLAGPVNWTRRWDGLEWKINPDWESLSASFKNLTGSTIGDADAGTLAGGGSGADGGGGGGGGGAGGGASAPSASSAEGCWVLVDEDWEPSNQTLVIAGIDYLPPLDPERSTPFNKMLMPTNPGEGSPGELTVRVNIDYATLCPGANLTPTLPEYYEALRLVNQLFLGQAGRYAFDNRSVIDKGDVLALPATPAANGETPFASGRITVAPVTIPGYRHIEKEGAVTTYNAAGQAVSYADQNHNLNWLQRDSEGKLVAVIDTSGRVLMSVKYQGRLVSDVRDYPDTDIPGDAPARSVHYGYDSFNRLVAVTDVRGFVTRYDYDNRHRLTRITDAEGRVEALTYKGNDSTVSSFKAADGGVSSYLFEYDDANKQFISEISGPETSAGRRKTQYAHNRIGRLLRRVVNGVTELESRYDTGTSTEIRTNQRGYSTRITKNEFGQVTGIVYPDGSRVQRRYDPRNMKLLEETDEVGVRTVYEYDGNGNLIKQTAAAGTADARITEYVRDARGLPQKITRKGRTEANGTITPDATVEISFDDRGQIREVKDPEGKIRKYVYDRRGNLVKEVEPLGQTSRYTYDSANSLLTQNDPLDTTNYVYDKVGNRISATDARNKIRTWGYDSVDREKSRKDPYGAEYATEYDVYGHVTKIIDASGQASRMDYDALQRLIQTTDGRGLTNQVDYTEADGTQRNLTEPRKLRYPTFQRQLRYDERDRLSLKSDEDGANGRVESYSYDGKGRRKTFTNANGKISTYEYNAFGEAVQTTDALGHTVSQLRDARGNIVQITDPNGHVTKFIYDRRNLLLQTTDPLGKTTLYTYDDNGRRIEVAQANGQRAGYQYDDDGQIKAIIEHSSSGTLVKTTRLSYDENNNLVSWDDGTYSALRAYDDAGRLSSEEVNYGAFSRSHSYTYHPNDQVKTYTGPDGITVSYDYDPLGQLQTLTIPDEGTISVTEWQWTAPKKTLLPGGVEQRRDYNGFLELTGLKTVNPSQVTVFDLQNQYGKLAELKQATRDGTTLNYAYDDAIRLTSVSASASGRGETFQLDATDNRTLYSRTGAQTWTYDDANQLLAAGPVTYAYDDAGNLVQKTDARLSGGAQTTRYVYDAFNRLSQVTDGADATIATYAYDPFNRRIAKVAGGTTTYYMQGDQGLLAEADSSGAIQISYGWTPEREYGTAPVYARVPGTEANSFRYLYYQNDQLGTPQRITDKTGAVLWAADYDAFGSTAIRTIAGDAVTNNLRFPGQYFDKETGLHYNLNRYYEPATGRYIGRDPISFKGGINMYLYANADPLSNIDPTGLRALTDCEKGALSPYIPQVDLDNADLHDGQVPWYLGSDFSGITRGNHIYFRPGVYDAGTTAGIALLGHELTHVGQYRNGMNAASYIWSTRNGYRNSPYEQEAYGVQGRIQNDLGSYGGNGACSCGQ